MTPNEKNAVAVVLVVMVTALGLAFAAGLPPSQLPAPQVSSPTHPDDSWARNNKPRFEWEKVAEAEFYTYSIDDNAGTTPTGNRTDKNSASFTNVLDGERYFHVAACIAAGCGPASHYRIRIDITPPSPVEGISGTALPDGSIKLEWNAQDDPSGIKEYWVFRSNVQRTVNNRYFLPSDPGVKKFQTIVTSIIDSDGLREGTAYYYRVLAVDNVGNIGTPSGVKPVRNVPAENGEAQPAPTVGPDANAGTDTGVGEVPGPGIAGPEENVPSPDNETGPETSDGATGKVAPESGGQGDERPLSDRAYDVQPQASTGGKGNAEPTGHSSAVWIIAAFILVAGASAYVLFGQHGKKADREKTLGKHIDQKVQAIGHATGAKWKKAGK